MNALFFLIALVALHPGNAVDISKPPVQLNHVYLVLDSVTYANIFTDLYLKDSMANCREDTVNTAGGSWFGKYMVGKNSYLEFFNVEGTGLGLTESSFGMGFITNKAGDLAVIKNEWQAITLDTVHFDTTYRVENGTQASWYYSIGLNPTDTMQNYYAWLMENTPEELRSRGFTDEEMRNEIPWGLYSVKRNGKPFTKYFDHISAMKININKKNFAYLEQSLTGMGLKKKGNTFYNESSVISYRLVDGSSSTVESITLDLTKKLPPRRIDVSPHLQIEIKGKKANLRFS
jgi:hypothetical protein